MKYVLDENYFFPNELLPNNMINASELYLQNGLKHYGVSDGKLLDLAEKHGYIILTRDMRLVIRANQKNANIIYVYGIKGKRWLFVPKNLNIKNRGELKKLYHKNIYNQRKDLTIVPQR